MRSGGPPPSSVSYSGHLDYVHNCMTTFVRAFNVPAVYMKLQIRVKVGINFTQTYEGICIIGTIKYMIRHNTCVCTALSFGKESLSA